MTPDSTFTKQQYKRKLPLNRLPQTNKYNFPKGFFILHKKPVGEKNNRGKLMSQVIEHLQTMTPDCKFTQQHDTINRISYRILNLARRRWEKKTEDS